jgi:hypothetical protein
VEAGCFPKPAFRAIASQYVMLELHWSRDQKVITKYGVSSFPNFAVLDGAGAVLVPPGRQLRDIVCGRPPGETAGILMGHQYSRWEESGKVPPSADVVIAQLDLLKSYGEAERLTKWLEKALAPDALAPEALACVQVYDALELRREGKLEEGLALLGAAVPALTFAEAPADSPGVAPFTVAHGETPPGAVSSDTAARLVYDALAWLATLEAGLPAEPTGDEPTLAVAAVSLAAVLDRPAEGAPWLAALRGKAGKETFARYPSAILADGLIMAAEGRLADGARRLLNVVAYDPGAAWAPAAGVRAYELAKQAGDQALADEAAKLVKETYVERLPEALAQRLAP